MAELRLEPLLRGLSDRGVLFIVNGSVAALALGVHLTPGDLDVAPELGQENLTRLAGFLAELEARPRTVQAADGSWTPFEGEWAPGEVGERNLDHRFVTAYGDLDVVPRSGGSYALLRPRAIDARAFGTRFLVAHPLDVLEHWRKWNRPRDVERLERLVTVVTSLPAGMDSLELDQRLSDWR